MVFPTSCSQISTDLRAVQVFDVGGYRTINWNMADRNRGLVSILQSVFYTNHIGGVHVVLNQNVSST